MDLLFLALRYAIAGVLVVSGIAKLLDRNGSRLGMENFGVPSTLAPMVAIALPIAEIVIAAFLIPTRFVYWSAGAAALLFLVFTVVVGRSVAQGQHLKCHCFGQLQSSPASWVTVGRNASLTILAGLVLGQSLAADAPGIRDQVSGMGLLIATGVLVLAAVIGGMAWLIMQLWAQQGRLLLRLEALEVDRQPSEPVPAESSVNRRGSALREATAGLLVRDLQEQESSLADLRPDSKPLLILFSDPKCSPCNSLMPEVAVWQHDHAVHFRTILVNQGAPEINRRKAAEFGLRDVYIQQDKQVSDALDSRGTPCAVLVDRDGYVVGAPTCGATQIRALVKDLSRRPQRSAQLVPMMDNQVGAPFPARSVSDLDGVQIALGAPADKPMMLVFWNPSCGFCQRMLPDLKDLEEEWSEEAGLVIISRGDEETNRQQGLRSPVVLDQDFGIGQSVGASGTPTAVLIDDQGRIASEVMVGASAILSSGAKWTTRNSQQLAKG